MIQRANWSKPICVKPSEAPSQLQPRVIGSGLLDGSLRIGNPPPNRVCPVIQSKTQGDVIKLLVSLCQTNQSQLSINPLELSCCAIFCPYADFPLDVHTLPPSELINRASQGHPTLLWVLLSGLHLLKSKDPAMTGSEPEPLSPDLWLAYFLDFLHLC